MPLSSEGKMYVDPIKLSVIVPAFNEEAHLAEALESVLFQNTDFKYEVLVVDDGSTDRTPEIIVDYAAKFPQIRSLHNPVNMGEGFSFRRALSEARGHYFQVLDGDDLFLDYGKIQKQVDFLESHPDCFAVAHNTLVLGVGGTVEYICRNSRDRRIGYYEALQGADYFHTSSFMYRKIAYDLPPAFLEEEMSGDSARFFYHLLETRRSFQYLNDIGSVYRFTGTGLWSGIDGEKRLQLTRDLFNTVLTDLVTDPQSYEYRAFSRRAELLASASPASFADPLGESTFEDLLEHCRGIAAAVYTQPVSDLAFQGMHGMRTLDQTCEAVGRLLMSQHALRLVGRTYDEHHVVFLVGGLVPQGGGIASEIRDLVQLHLDRGERVTIASTNAVPTNRDTFEKFFPLGQVDFWLANSEQPYVDQVWDVIEYIWGLAPYRLYPFISHHDVVASASVQKGLAGEIVFDYVYDHGTSMGIHNSSIDVIVGKTQSQIGALASALPRQKLVHIPPFVADKHLGNPYSLSEGRPLVTASGAARGYKVETSYVWDYCEIVANILDITGGRHFHYGPLSETYLQQIHWWLEHRGVDPASFVHIEFAEDFSASLLEIGVDVFLTPFPVPSARLAIEVESCGIPLLVHEMEHPALPTSGDFCDPQQWTWKSPSDIYDLLLRLDRLDLLPQSRSAREYYERTNAYEAVAARWISLKATQAPRATVTDSPPSFRLVDLAEVDFYPYQPFVSKNVPKPNSEEERIVVLDGPVPSGQRDSPVPGKEREP